MRLSFSLLIFILISSVARAEMPTQNPALSEVQQQKLSSQLSSKGVKLKIKNMIAEAKPNLEKVLGMQACGYKANELGIYRANASTFNEIQPLYFPKHDASQCLNVERISTWKASAKNALTFVTMYVSEQSGESTQLTHEIQKQADGSWLFNY